MLNTNILIVGAGVSGIAAAVSVARQGKKVVLIDNHSYPGGAAIASEIGTICGLYENGKDADFLVDSFAKEFALKVAEYSKSDFKSNQYGLHYLPYKTEALRQLIEDYIQRNNIQFLPNVELIRVSGTTNSLSEAVIVKNNQSMTINFEAIIDCSGKAIVADLTNHPLVESHYFQAASINFFVKNSAILDDEISNFKLIRELKKIIIEHKFPDYLKNLFVIPGSQSDDKIGFKFTIPWEVSHENGAIEKLTIQAKELVLHFFSLLQKHSQLFENATIDHIAEDLGWRTGKRPLGKYVLTQEDVLSARKWENSMVKSAWPIEDWLPNKSVELAFIPSNDYYEIPNECLISVKYSNLFFAGRIISATDKAIASARVMGVCLQTGYAAGELATK